MREARKGWPTPAPIRTADVAHGAAALEPLDFGEDSHLQALEWQVILWSGEVTAAEQQGFQHWLNAQDKNAQAWQRIQAINHHIDALPHLKGAAAALRAGHSPQKRRTVLRAIAALFTVAGVGYAVKKTPLWQIAQADLTTDYGHIQTHTLADGSQISLNAATAVDVVFSDTARRLRLLRGEILITTAANGPQAQLQRPFWVETAQGSLQAIGTQFNVRVADSATQVAVLEGMVDIRPEDQTQGAVRLQAGQQTRFERSAIETPKAIAPGLTAWTRNRIVLEQVSLQDFAKELERYRRGIVQVDPAIAELRLSGSFPLDDTDQALRSLTYSLPVQIKAIAPLWVRIVPA